MEFITITLSVERFKELNLLTSEYEVKHVKVIDDIFKNDQQYKELKRIADKAYDKLDEYMFNKRNNIK